MSILSLGQFLTADAWVPHKIPLGKLHNLPSKTDMIYPNILWGVTPTYVHLGQNL